MAKKLDLVRLRDLPRGSLIHDAAKHKLGHKEFDCIIKFHHIDGMYSYNTVLDMDQRPIKTSDNMSAVVHLSNSCILKRVDDHYVMATDKETEEYNKQNYEN